jgi:hypothetical protein
VPLETLKNDIICDCYEHLTNDNYARNVCAVCSEWECKVDGRFKKLQLGVIELLLACAPSDVVENLKGRYHNHLFINTGNVRMKSCLYGVLQSTREDRDFYLTVE